MIIKFLTKKKTPGRYRTREVYADGVLIGKIYRKEKTRHAARHWSGEIVNDRGETWRICETTLDAVINRIAEAYENKLN